MNLKGLFQPACSACTISLLAFNVAIFISKAYQDTAILSMAYEDTVWHMQGMLLESDY